MSDYEIQESKRAKYLRVSVHPDGKVVVTKPPKVSLRQIEQWLSGKQEWIETARIKFAKGEERFERAHGKPIPLPKLRRGTKAYKEVIQKARSLATERSRYFASLGGFTYGTISIRNQKTRWGSCSTHGNISFNYRLVHLPAELIDYLVVHELAHTKHHNHSVNFWAEVERIIPNFKRLRNELHRYRF